VTTPSNSASRKGKFSASPDLNATLFNPALAQRALAFSSIASVASKATTELASGASVAVTTPGPQATSSNLPRRASPSAAPKRPGSSAFAAQWSKFCGWRANSSATLLR
jgi:hypothetical protein